MATMATYRAIDPVTIIAGLTGNVTIPRGARCSLSTDAVNTCYPQDVSARGDFVALQDIPPGLTGAAVRLNTGADVVMLLANGITVAPNDNIYSANGGFVSNVSAGAVYIGVAREAATGIAGGTLFGVLLQTVA